MGYTLQDFQWTYTFDKAAKTITFSWYYLNSLKDIAVITDVTNWIVIYNFADWITWTFVQNTQVLTLTYNTNTVSFNNTDDLVINLFAQAALDFTTDTEKVITQNPDSSYNTDIIPLISAAQTLTASFADIWFEIPCSWFKVLFLWVKLTIQQATNIQIQALSKHTSAGTEEYNFINVIPWNPNIISSEIIQLPDSNWLYCIPFNIANGIPFIQFQIKETDNWTDATLDTCYYTLGY